MNDSPQAILARRFGFEKFRGLQEEVIRHTLAGGHSLVMMPTGGGKSLCFQIPALMLAESSPSNPPPLTLVLSPLVALMKDQVDALVERGIDATLINSSLTAELRQQRYLDVASGKWRLLYVTPERFRKPEFLSMIAQRSVRLLAVDEAHCISEWGHDFRPDYSRLAEIRALLGFPTTMALTATATPDVQIDILRQLGLNRHECQLFHSGIDRPNLELGIERVWGFDEKLEIISRQMETAFDEEPGDRGSGIVYFTLIKTLEAFSYQLKQRGHDHLCYHGDLSRGARREVQEAFMKGETRWVLATNAFGMGIDKEDIRAVIHAEVPSSMEAYYQEIGRAGRDGKRSACLLLYDPADLETQLEFLRWSNPDADYYQRLYDFLALDAERIRAMGIEWLRERLSAKYRHDRRLETALGMLQRYGVIEDERDLSNVLVRGALPESLSNPSRRSEKLLRDQRKLYSMVEYAQRESELKQFIAQYFGLADSEQCTPLA